MDEKNYMASAESLLQPVDALVPKEQLLASAQAIVNDLTSSMPFDTSTIMDDIISAAAELTKPILLQNNLAIQNLTRSLTDLIDSVPPDTLVSVEKTKSFVEEIKPCLPLDAAASIDEKIEKAEIADAKIPWGKIKEIILFVVAIWSLFLQLKPDPQTEIQTEMLELQKREAEQSEEFRQRTEEHFKIVEDAQERIAQAVEVLVDQLIEADNESDSLVDPVDPQDVLKSSDALQKQTDG